MKFLPLAKSWRNALLILFGLFLLSRILTLTAFPIFNDEAIYLQYAQRIHENWQQNKFISMHGEFADWKPPLIYWLVAPVIEWGNDPLVPGRAVALVVSLAGLFGFYLFARELFGDREGVISAGLYVLCPPVLLHNNQFTAETFLFAAAAFFYWALLKAMDRAKSRWWVWAGLAVLFGVALLLIKQSGFLLLAVAGFLPLARIRAREGAATDRKNWTSLAANVGLVVAVIVCSSIAANAFLPAAFNATRDQFNSQWVMSVAELLRFPTKTWQSNLGVVADYIGSYYTWAVALFFGGFSLIALRRKNFPELTLAAMCLAGAAGISFLLRGFNEYVLNTAVIVGLLPLLARMVVVLSAPARTRKGALVRFAALAIALLALSNWIYQDIVMRVSPGKYIERSTPWAIDNYLKNWSTGFGVREIVTILEKEQQPGVIVADSQWGNPRTALEVYGKRRFPNLRIVPVTREFLDQAETRKLKDFIPKLGPVHLVIYSADSSGQRRSWQLNLEEQMCQTRREIKAYPSQSPIVVCSF